MSNFKPTNKSNPCPLCGDIKGGCRSTHRLVDGIEEVLLFCRKNPTGPSTSGWFFLGTTKGQYEAGMYKEFDETKAGVDLTDEEKKAQRIKRNKKRAEQKAAAAIEDAARKAALTSLESRNKYFTNKLHNISLSQNADLLKRGLTQAEIDRCLELNWIWGDRNGYGIAAIDPKTGFIVGGQKANDHRSPKYSWLLKGDTHLPETDENPLTVWVNPAIDMTAPIEVRLAEGFLKPLVSAIKAWRKDKQIIYVGAAGCTFPEAALNRVLDALPLNADTKFLLCPDAGAVSNPQVVAGYKALYKLLPDMKVLFWSQWRKGIDSDIDEVLHSTVKNELNWTEFYSLTLGTDINSIKQWKSTRVFTPDASVDSKYFDYRSVSIGEILGVNSGLGTGKTEWVINEVLGNFEGAVILSPTINLCTNLNERVERSALTVESIRGFEKATEEVATSARVLSLFPDLVTEVDPPTLPTDNKVVTEAPTSARVLTLCPDSIMKVEINDVAGQVLIIDEAQECAKVFWYRATHIAKNRKACINRLGELMAAASGVVLVDGNLSDSVCAWYHALCPSKSLQKVKNVQASTMGINLHIGNGDASNFDFLASISQNDKKWILGTDSKSDASALSEFPLTSLTCKVGVMGSSGSLSESWAQEAMRSGHDFIKKHNPKNMAYSPVAGSGWDLSNVNGYFAFCYGYFCGVNRVDDISQSIARYRDFSVIRDVFVAAKGLEEFWAIDSKSTSKGEVDEVIYAFLAEIKEALKLGENDVVAAITKKMVDQCSADPTHQAIANEIAAANFERQHLRGCFIQSQLDSGNKISLSLILAIDSELKAENTQAKRNLKLDLASSVAVANTIGSKEAERIQSASLVAPAKIAELARFTLESRLPGIALCDAWNSKELNEKGEVENASFIHRLPKLAPIAEKFWLMQHPEVSLKRGQARWQRFINDSWIDLSKLKIEYPRIKKLRDALMVANPAIFNGVESVFIYSKSDVNEMVKTLITGRSAVASLKGMTYLKFLKTTFKPYGVDFSEGADGAVEASLPCLDPASDLGQVFKVVVDRSVPQLIEAQHKWEVPIEPATPELVEVPEPATPEPKLVATSDDVEVDEPKYTAEELEEFLSITHGYSYDDDDCEDF